MKEQFVTVVYRIVEEAAWANGGNPLKYAHNGLSACTVSIGDVIVDRDELVDALEDIVANGDCTSREIAKRVLYDKPEMTQ